ncbi:penicillin-binding protein, beta-lactamase class C [Bernardetia litoralis DSM 6794]|uniref:Penicillin-binding protein, beta-lactamase class C n=1 Tax=Bernardetia litoralis (strain ATCC 23117 / DSM 6794 / NBRC 15988 / NCIMB 1366 / Fx l1 / Sio-4) TaxID=880071 RepID=I4AF31_BERLS|nr:serine hydrolase [Bernardetia litoralis]AFM02566.1 penicillin-binding protein, beta-lactamase class C [Bernardetia litoralis DSM 6794]
MQSTFIRIFIAFILLFFPSNFIQAQNLYFPPLVETEENNWETIPTSELEWCDEQIDSLYTFLDEKNTKGFIVLKDGKIVLEKYFGTFTQDSAWYWASAGKSMVATLIGIAQRSSLLDVNKKTSTYLGEGWTNLIKEQEDKITIRHQMTMTTGLKEPDITGIDNCLTPSCLTYGSAPDTRWYYYNSPYRLLQNVLDSATGKPINQYFAERITRKTGITGAFLNYTLFSKPRSMARFGLLMLNRGKWETNPVLNDAMYFEQMTNTSQLLNPSYGYLWWLNGKDSYKLPASDEIFEGSMIPNAPSDMIAALGANDQKIYIVPSQNLVVVRVGNSAESEELNALSSFDNELWGKLSNLSCHDPILTNESKGEEETMKIFPNPSYQNYFLKIPNGRYDIAIRDSLGKIIYKAQVTHSFRIAASKWKKGMYFVEITPVGTKTTTYLKIVKE